MSSYSGENFSTDDAEETANSRPSPALNNKNHSKVIDNTSAFSTSKLIDLTFFPKRLYLILDKDDSTISLYNSSPKSENGYAAQQQHAAVQTNVTANKTERSSQNTGRRSLFKGKSLATLMNERQKISLTRERRLSRTLGIIISVFLLCWLPFFVVYILSAFIDVSLYIKEPLPTLILWLGYINSACNPLIYTVFNVEFRTAFKRLLCPGSVNNNSLNRNYTNRQSRN